MDANLVSYQPAMARPEMGSLLAVVSMMIDDQRSIVLHVTSSQHGEGTTTVARQLAGAVAASGWCRVALLNAGPQEPDMPILPAVLDGFEREETPMLRRGRMDGVEIAFGSLTSPRQSQPRVESVRKLYGWMRSEYALTVIDCPPVLAARDAAVLASLADGTLLVVEAERTRLSEIKRTRDILEQVGAATVGVALNKRRRRIPRLLERLL